ncbi:MAG TPA: hypothetical protein VFR74_16260 [Jiangellales bacterium]|nr:hypothetical protein [Jiangellales bacterium]
MSAVTTLLWGRPLTRDDLESLPDDGHRYELLDGALLVTPAPTPRHQWAVMGLIAVLTAHVVPPLGERGRRRAAGAVAALSRQHPPGRPGALTR